MNKPKIPAWLALSLLVPVLWGVWGAFIDIPRKHTPSFPDTLSYIVWSLTMVPCALIALGLKKWKLKTSPKAIFYGLLVGITGAGGQLVLFKTLAIGPAYIVFPVISLSPVVTVIMSFFILRERAGKMSALGIILSLVAILLLSIQEPDTDHITGYWWLVGSLAIFAAWGLQAFFIKSSAGDIDDESMYAYMTISGLLLAPVAIMMTDFGKPINYGWSGPGLAALIQSLNSIGALLLVYAIRKGKSIIVVPMINGLAPLITIVLSLIVSHVFPIVVNVVGMFAAIVAVVLIAFDEASGSASKPPPARVALDG